MDDDTKLTELLESQIGPVPDTGIKYPDITVELTGQDGNAFNLISIVQKVLREQVSAEASLQFSSAAMFANSYDDLLGLIQRTVNVV